ncbi:MAG: LL-diaminopimelate aminotransferase [Thermoleophilaceae bacterium]
MRPGKPSARTPAGGVTASGGTPRGGRVLAAKRLDRLPPYLFAELERKVSEKRAAGVDVISLGIGDPDTPTPPDVVEALATAALDPGTHRYPSNRGRPELRQAFARFYERRFGVPLDPDSEVVPALGAKECVFNLNLAFLDPDSIALAADPGYPVYTGGPLLAGAEAVLMPLLPERGFAPDLDAIGGDVAARARLLYLNYPNNPTGAVVPGGLFERAVEFAREHDVLVVHDASYTETTYDGYVAPSFLATPGARDVGVEVFSLSKGWNMTGWRTAALVGNAGAVSAYWRLKTNIDSGVFEAVQLAAAAALDAGPPAEMPATYQRRRDLVCDALRAIGVEVTPPKGTIYVWAPVPEGHTSVSYCEMVLEESAVVISPGSAYGPNGEGFFRISLTIDDERLSEAVERMRESLA